MISFILTTANPYTDPAFKTYKFSSKEEGFKFLAQYNLLERIIDII